LSITGFHLALSDDKALDLYGKIDQKGPVSLSAKGEIPLSVIHLFSSDFSNVAGNAFFEASVRGDFIHPEVEGEIRLADISATLPFLSQNLHSVNGTVRLTPEKIFIDALAGQLDDGRFSIVGNMAMQGFSPSELTLDIQAGALPIRIPDTMEVSLNAALFVRGTPENARLDGSITLEEGTYFKDVNLSLFEGAISRKRQTLAPSDEISVPFLKNMTLNVMLKDRNPFVVDNNLAKLEIVPDLKLTGTLNRPIISGRADIQNGTVVYRKKVFTVDKGVIDFINPYAIEPTLAVESSSQIRDWLVSLKISGTPDELDFALSSIPALDDGDILSLMLTGRTTSEMILSEGGSTQSAAQMLGQILASKMDDDIKRTMGLDIFEAEINGASDAQSAGEVKVTIGKELSTRMTVKYSMETQKGEMIQKALAEYKFFNDILVSGFQDNRGSFGGSIKYRLEYR
jgi:autotransporter translocation and assembly factor TamB